MLNQFSAYTKKTIIIRVTVVYLFLCSLSVPFSYADDICSGRNATLSCLKNNFNELYALNYSQFWDILIDAEKEALKCKSTLGVGDFLKLINLKSINAEFNEYYKEAIENMLLQKPTCFLDSLAALDKTTITFIIDNLKRPLLVEESKIYKTFRAYRSMRKYNNIMQVYFNESKDSHAEKNMR